MSGNSALLNKWKPVKYLTRWHKAARWAVREIPSDVTSHPPTCLTLYLNEPFLLIPWALFHFSSFPTIFSQSVHFTKIHKEPPPPPPPACSCSLDLSSSLWLRLSLSLVSMFVERETLNPSVAFWRCSWRLQPDECSLNLLQLNTGAQDRHALPHQQEKVIRSALCCHTQRNLWDQVGNGKRARGHG